MQRTRYEQRRYEEVRASGQLGKTVVYGSRPATDAQIAAIERMARRAGLRIDEAIKAAIGKRPIGGLNRERASVVIDWLAQQMETQQ